MRDTKAPDAQFFLAMMKFSERGLLTAAQQGEVSPKPLEYCQGVIDLTIQGKRVSKTRKQWADYLIGMTREGVGRPCRVKKSSAACASRFFLASSKC